MARELKPCGTVAAYRRHCVRKEEACAPCKEAMRLCGEQRRKNPPECPRKLAPCGTYGGAQRHARRKEEPCGPCLVARRERKSVYEAAARAAKQERREALDRMLAEVLAEDMATATTERCPTDAERT